MTSCCTIGAVISWIRGDSRTYRFTVLDKDTQSPIDITGWPIAAEVWDAATGQIKKATANITDGSDSQILIINATSGIFEVYFLKDETSDFEVDAEIEVAEYSNSGKNTIYQAKIKFEDSKIDWVVIP